MSTSNNQGNHVLPTELREIITRMTQETGDKNTVARFIRYVQDTLAESKNREYQLSSRVSNAESQLQVQAGWIKKYKRVCEEFAKYITRLNQLEDAMPSKEPPEDILLDLNATKQQINAPGAISDVFAPHQIPRAAPETFSTGKPGAPDVQRATQTTDMMNSIMSDGFLNPIYPSGNNFMAQQNPNMTLFGDFGN